MSNVKSVVQEMSREFVSKLVGVLKSSTVQELMALQGEEKVRLKPGPKPGKKYSKKPGPKSGKKPGRKPGRKPGLPAKSE